MRKPFHSFLVLLAVLGLLAGCGSDGKKKSRAADPTASDKDGGAGRGKQDGEGETGGGGEEAKEPAKAPQEKTFDVHVTAPEVSDRGVEICRIEVEDFPLTLEEIRSWLKREADGGRDPEDARLSTKTLRIRTHKETPYKYVQFLLQECVRPGVGVWKLRVLEGDRNLPIFLPTDGNLVHDGRDSSRLPIRIVLRMNPNNRKCKVYVGQVLCNYDDQGIGKAGKLVKEIVEKGVNTAEIDAGGDVPMHWVLEALDMLVRARLEKIHFTGAIERADGK
jgi:hypothetical protein